MGPVAPATAGDGLADAAGHRGAGGSAWRLPPARAGRSGGRDRGEGEAVGEAEAVGEGADVGDGGAAGDGDAEGDGAELRAAVTRVGKSLITRA